MAFARDSPATTLGLVLLVVLGAYTLLTPTNVLLGLVLPAIVIVPVARYVDGLSDEEDPDEERPRK